jgi:cyclohexanone monooxygenase
VLDEQSRHIAYILEQAHEREVRTVDVSEAAEAGWVRTVVEASVANLAFLESCTPGYYNNEGHPNGDLVRQNGTYAPGIMVFANKLREWREEGALAGLELC